MGLSDKYPAVWSDLESVGRLTGAIHELKLLRNERTKSEWTATKNSTNSSSIDYENEIASAPDLTDAQAAQRRMLLDLAIQIVTVRRDKLMFKVANAFLTGELK